MLSRVPALDPLFEEGGREVGPVQRHELPDVQRRSGHAVHNPHHPPGPRKPPVICPYGPLRVVGHGRIPGMPEEPNVLPADVVLVWRRRTGKVRINIGIGPEIQRGQREKVGARGYWIRECGGGCRGNRVGGRHFDGSGENV